MPGLLHDVCSAVHPMAVASPFLRSLDLERYGLEWCWPEVDLAHPLDDGSAGVLLQLDRCDGRRPGGGRRALAARFRRRSSAASTRSPRTSCGRCCICRGTPSASPASACRAATPATAARSHVRRRKQAQALFGGVAAHAFSPLNRPMSSAVGMALICACHRAGWAVAKGGSRRDHRRARLGAARARRPGRDGCPRHVAGRAPPADAPVFDLAPAAVADIAGDRLPRPRSPRLSPLQARPGGVQARPRGRGRSAVDERGVRKAGTVHAAARFEEIVAARARHQSRPDARTAVCPGRPAVPGRPEPLRRRRPSRLGLRARPVRLRRRRERMRCSTNSSASLPGCASGSSRRRSARRPSSSATTRTT